MTVGGVRFLMFSLFVGAITSILVSCGGGGDSPGGGSDPAGGGASGGGGGSGSGVAGIYMGSNLYRCDVQAMLALVTEDGRVADFHSVGAEMDYGIGLAEVGSVSGSGPAYSADVTEYRIGGPSILSQVAVEPANVTVEVVSISSGGFTVKWPGRAPEFCTEVKKTLPKAESLSVRPASLNKLAGVYSSAGNAQSGYSIAISIDASGQLTGSDSEGCVIGGSVVVPRADRNHYSMMVSVDSCPSQGAYVGDAVLADGMNGGQDNLLLMGLLRADHALAVNLALSR